MNTSTFFLFFGIGIGLLPVVVISCMGDFNHSKSDYPLWFVGHYNKLGTNPVHSSKANPAAPALESSFVWAKSRFSDSMKWANPLRSAKSNQFLSRRGQSFVIFALAGFDTIIGIKSQSDIHQNYAPEYHQPDYLH